MLTNIPLLVALVIKGLIMWESKCHLVSSDGYVKYEEAEVDRSAIMKDFRDNEKKCLNGRLPAISDFITAKFVIDYPCVRHYTLFYIHSPAI